MESKIWEYGVKDMRASSKTRQIVMETKKTLTLIDKTPTIPGLLNLKVEIEWIYIIGASLFLQFCAINLCNKNIFEESSLLWCVVERKRFLSQQKLGLSFLLMFFNFQILQLVTRILED